jgi:hypothetical protein
MLMLFSKVPEELFSCSETFFAVERTGVLKKIEIGGNIEYLKACRLIPLVLPLTVNSFV